MLEAFISKFKAAPEDVNTLNQANVALHERMEHMLRINSLSARIVKLEVQKPVLVKKPVSIRKAFAA